MILTQEELKKRLSYDKETGLFRWRGGVVRRLKNNEIAGRIGERGYIQIGINKKLYLSHRLAWLYVYGEFPSNLIDHIDGNPSNNRIENLRECTDGENQLNRKINSNNKSGHKGVCWAAHANKWKATGTGTKKREHLGYFDSKEEAVKVYQEFCLLHHGEFYRDTTT